VRPAPCSANLETKGSAARSTYGPGNDPQGHRTRRSARLTDYEEARSVFTWDRARGAPAGLPEGGLNIAHEAVDRHAASERADKVALRCIARDNAVTDVTYAELARRTSRFANVGPDDTFRDALEMDSLDFLSCIEILGERTGVRIDSTTRTHHSSPRCPAVPTSSSPMCRERCRRRPGAGPG